MKNGVHKGFMLSLMLYDIYMDDMIKSFKGRWNNSNI